MTKKTPLSKNNITSHHSIKEICPSNYKLARKWACHCYSHSREFY